MEETEGRRILKLSLSYEGFVRQVELHETCLKKKKKWLGLLVAQPSMSEFKLNLSLDPQNSHQKRRKKIQSTVAHTCNPIFIKMGGKARQTLESSLTSYFSLLCKVPGQCKILSQTKG